MRFTNAFGFLAAIVPASAAILSDLSVNGGYPLNHWGWHLAGSSAPPPAGGVQNATFKQLIDHKNPSLGTFNQFYYYDTTYWKGPGSPVVLFTPGEVNATLYTNYLVTNRTTGVLAQKIGAATIVLEHRFWGTSTPYAQLTTANLQTLTLENAIADLNYFAKNVKLPFAKNCDSNADAVPWVLMGGSYSGSLSAWTASTAPGTIWAYHCSSGPVQAISDYWSYFLPIQQGMPKNCSKDVSAVIEYMDNILTNGSAAQVTQLKTMFGMQSVQYNDDFMAALAGAPSLWQGNQFYQTTGFYTWCDYVENAVNAPASKLPGANGVGLQKALAGYAKWWKEVGLPGSCESYGYFQGVNNTDCFNLHNPKNPIYTDTSLANTADRQWVWMTCNQPFGYWQGGAPTNRPTIVSRLVNPDYFVRQCGYYFPKGPQGQTFGINKGITEDDVNTFTGGWNINNTTRLVYTNGQFDPWRESGVSSDLRPNGPLKSTAQVPVNIVPGGFHTSDLVTKNGVANAGCQKVITSEVNQLAAWVAEFPKKSHWKA